jgi:hypothetical protein
MDMALKEVKGSCSTVLVVHRPGCTSDTWGPGPRALMDDRRASLSWTKKHVQ